MYYSALVVEATQSETLRDSVSLQAAQRGVDNVQILPAVEGYITFNHRYYSPPPVRLLQTGGGVYPYMESQNIKAIACLLVRRRRRENMCHWTN